MKIVYAFGPIAGFTYDKAEDWRRWLAAELLPHGIKVVSPLRFKEALRGAGVLSGHGRDYGLDSVLTTDKAILARDKFDVLRADMLAGNFLDARQPSIGSMFEMAWAHEAHTPIAAAVPPDAGHPHDHLFFNETLDFRVHNLADLRDVCLAVLA